MGFTQDGEDTVLTIMRWMTQTDTLWGPERITQCQRWEKKVFYFDL